MTNVKTLSDSELFALEKEIVDEKARRDVLQQAVFQLLSEISPPPLPEPSAALWEPGKEYFVGDAVVYDKITYWCMQEHRAEEYQAPLNNPTLWTIVQPN